MGNIILRNLMSTFTGKIYPVNDKADSVEGLSAHRSLLEIGERVDLAIISVPKDSVINVMEDAGRAGVKEAIVITSGFRETGDVGARLEEELKAAVREAERIGFPLVMKISPNEPVHKRRWAGFA